MLFAISTDTTGRAILDSDLHGDILAVIEADDWIEARQLAWKEKALDPFSYRGGYGWFDRERLLGRK